MQSREQLWLYAGFHLNQSANCAYVEIDFKMSTKVIHRTRARTNTPVTVLVSVTAVPVRGVVTESDLAGWVKDAISHYHRFRVGHVGLHAAAGIKPPDVEEV